MPRHRETRALPYTAEQMFALVADVGSYPQFLPWITAVRIRSNTETEMLADVIGYHEHRDSIQKVIRGELTKAARAARGRPILPVGLSLGGIGRNFPVVWTRKGIVVLGTIPANEITPAGINDHGDVIGNAVLTPDRTVVHALLWPRATRAR